MEAKLKFILSPGIFRALKINRIGDSNTGYDDLYRPGRSFSPAFSIILPLAFFKGVIRKCPYQI